MSEMNQIEPEECIGKSVKSVYDTADGLVVMFTDDTYIFPSMVGSFGEYHFTTSTAFTEEASPKDLLAAGIISQAEANELEQKKKAEDTARRHDQYQKLKQEFENK